MPFGSQGPESGIGLALSGGGFRATLFHCGAFWRLNGLGCLQKLDRVSSVSGGSIGAGLLGLKWEKLRQSDWKKEPLGVLEDVVVEKTEQVRQHFEKVTSREYEVATHLSEAARPVLAGVGSDIRQRVIDVLGGSVIGARNAKYDPDRFPASA
jgi:predicted acylesterase/phospholipase RssA